MTAGIRVVCDDLDTRRWIDDWLAGMRLTPSAELTLRVRVTDAAPIEPPDARTPFLQPDIEIRSGPPEPDVRLRWLAGPAHAVLPAGATTADVALGRAALANREHLAQSFLTTVLVFLLRRAGWHHVHAAVARDPRGRGWLFAGNSKAGKSTTAALLATKGWGVGSDDLTFLTRSDEDVDAIAQRAPIALRPEGHALLNAGRGTPVRGGRKTAYFPEELGGSSVERVRPTIIMLPRVEGGTTRVEPIRPREALAELVRWSAWVVLEPDLAQEHLDLLGQLARQAACWRLALGPDLFRDQDVLMELVP